MGSGARPDERGAGQPPVAPSGAKGTAALKGPQPPTPNKAEDKVTLILHPAPKASAGRAKRAARPMTAKEALRAKAAKRVAQQSGKPATVSGLLPSDEAVVAERELGTEWLDAEADGALAVLAEAGSQGEQLIQAWQERGNVQALVAVGSLDASAAERAGRGALRKAARRALNVLRSRGVAIPEPTVREAAVSLTAAEAPAEAPVATFVSPDGSGTLFLSITQRQASGRYRVADAVVRDVVGIVHASSGRLAGKQLRRWRARVEERVGASPVDVPVEWARWRIARARAQNAVSKQVLPLGLDGCAPLFQPVPEQAPPHPVADLGHDLSDAEVTAAVSESAKLHGEPELRSWMADRPAVDAMLQRVGAKVGGASASDRDRVNAALDEEIAAATDRYFTPEARQLLSERLHDAAISVRARAGDDAARRLLALAKGIREAGLITSPPRDIPFLTGFFGKAIGVLASQGGGQLRVPVAPGVLGADRAADAADGAAAAEGDAASEGTEALGSPLDEPEEGAETESDAG